MSEQFIPGTATTFRCDPVDGLIGIHDVACLAMNTVRGVDLQTKRAISFPRIRHLINGGRAKGLAGIAILSGAAGMANIRL